MRKRFVVIVTILTMLALLLSACGRERAEPPKPDTSAVQKEGIFNGAWPYEVPPKMHYNVFATGNLGMAGSPFTDLMTSPLALYEWATNTYVPQLATDWQIAEKTITVNLRKGVKWSDGSSLTVDDIMVYMNIGKAKNYPIWRFVDRVEQKDDHTAVFHLRNPATIATRYVLRELRPQPASVYGEWANQFAALYAQGNDPLSDEVTALVKEFDAFRPAAYVASGPYVMDVETIIATELNLMRRADAWNADLAKFDRIRIYNGEGTAITQRVLDRQIDFATQSFPPAIEWQIAAQGIRVVRYPFYNGPAIFFNYDIPLYNKVAFRQALAYVIDRHEVGAVALDKSGIGVKQMAGMSDNLVAAWMTPADAAKLNPYEQDLKKAEELMVQAGLQKGKDGWTDASGKPVEIAFATPSDFTDWTAAAQNVVQQLNNFGLRTTLRGAPWSQHASDMDRGRFQMGFLPFGTGIPHPQFSFLASLVNYNAGGQTGNKDNPGMNWPLQQKWSGGDINFAVLLTESGKGMDVEKQKEVVAKIALAMNELLPTIQIFERYSNSPVLENIHVTGWPADTDPIMTNASGDNFVTHLILLGKLAPVK